MKTRVFASSLKVRFGLLCIVCGYAARAAESNLLTMESVLTNFPPVKNLLIEAQFFSPQPTLLQFRYQEGSLYARQLSDGNPQSAFFNTPKDESFGRWGEDYWFLTPGFQQPSRSRPTTRSLLTTGVATGIDTAPLRAKALRFESIFSYFASFGITPDGVNTVSYVGTNIEAFVRVHIENRPEEQATYTATVIRSNGLPIGAMVQTRIESGMLKPLYLAYKYDTNSVPMPFPSEIILTQRVPRPGFPEDADVEKDGTNFTLLHLIVRDMELAERSEKLSRNLFMPDPELLNSNYLAAVMTNGQSYRIEGDRLVSMSISQEALDKALRGGRNRPRLFVIALFVIICLLVPIALIRRWNEFFSNNNKPQQQDKP